MGKSASNTLPGDPRDLIRNGKFKDADIIFGWNKNEGSWFNVYMLEGFSKDGNSHIGQDSFVRNLDLAGLELNRIGINAVAFEYSPWANPGDAAGTKY